MGSSLRARAIVVGLACCAGLAFGVALALQPGHRDLAVEPFSVTITHDEIDRYRIPARFGDLNDDSYEDIVISTTRFDGPAGTREEAGIVAVFFGGPSLPAQLDLTADADLLIYGAYERQRFGQSIVVDDVNGDGIDDLLVSSSDFGGAPQSGGRLDIFFGSSSLPALIDLATTPADVSIRARSSSQDLGSSFAVGDVDGDSLVDLIVSARLARPPGGAGGAGETYIFFNAAALSGEIDMATVAPDVTIYGVDEADFFANEMEIANFDGDLFDDIVLGTQQGGLSIGEVRIVRGRASWPSVIDLATDSDAVLSGNAINESFANVILVEDIIGDATPDLIVGAQLYGGARGRVYLFDGSSLLGSFGAASGLADHIVEGADTLHGFGGDVSIGDVDADGTAELIALSPRTLPGGTAYSLTIDLLAAGPVTVDLAPVEADVDGLAGDSLSHSAIGDFNNDGIADLVLAGGLTVHVDFSGELAPPPVGGIALDSALRSQPLETAGPASSPWAVAIAIAAAASIVVLGVTLYARRRSLLLARYR